MTRCEWIVCERAARWAPALRTAVPLPGSEHISIVEVRSLAELGSRIEDANHVAIVEVTLTNLGAVLSWLATKSRGTGNANIAAVDQDLKTPAIVAALREAGAVDVADSPRRLQSAIRVGLSFSAASHRPKPVKLLIGQSFETWARSLLPLPWQAAR